MLLKFTERRILADETRDSYSGWGKEAAPSLAIIIEVAQLFSVVSVNNSNTILLDSGGKISGEISVNQGVSQGCSSSPILVSICSGDLIRTWKTVKNPRIKKNNTF